MILSATLENPQGSENKLFPQELVHFMSFGVAPLRRVLVSLVLSFGDTFFHIALTIFHGRFQAVNAIKGCSMDSASLSLPS